MPGFDLFEHLIAVAAVEWDRNRNRLAHITLTISIESQLTCAQFEKKKKIENWIYFVTAVILNQKIKNFLELRYHSIRV